MKKKVLSESHRLLSAVLDQLELVSEMVYANDGGSDDSPCLMQSVRAADPRVAALT